MESREDLLEVKMENGAAEFSSEENTSDWPEDNMWNRVSKVKCKPFTCIESNTSHTGNDVKCESGGAHSTSDGLTETGTDMVTGAVGSKSISSMDGQKDKRPRSEQQFFPNMPGLKRVNLLSEFRKNKPRQDNESHEAYLHRTHVEYSQLSGEARQSLLKQVSRERMLDSPRKKREFAIRLSKKMKQLQKFIEERGGIMSFHALIGGRHVMAVSNEIQDIEERLQYNEEIECVTVSTPENEVDVSDSEDPVEPKKETTTALRKKTLRHQVQKILNAAFSKASGIEGTRCPYSNLPSMDVIGWPYGVASIRNPKHYGVGDLKKIIKNKDIISFSIHRKDALQVSRSRAPVTPAPPGQPKAQTPVPMVGSGPDAGHCHQYPNGSFPSHTDLRPVGPFTTHTDLRPNGPFASHPHHDPSGPFTNHPDQNPTGPFASHPDQHPSGPFSTHTDLRPVGPFTSHPDNCPSGSYASHQDHCPTGSYASHLDHCPTGSYASHPDQRPNGPFASQPVPGVSSQQEWGQAAKGQPSSVCSSGGQSASGSHNLQDLGRTDTGALADQSHLSKKPTPYAYQQLLDGELQALFAAITGGDTVQATNLTSELHDKSGHSKGADPVQATSVTAGLQDGSEHSKGADTAQTTSSTRPLEDKGEPNKGVDPVQTANSTSVLQDKSGHSQEEGSVHGTSLIQSEDKKEHSKGRVSMSSTSSTRKLKKKNKHKAAKKPPVEEVKEPPAKRFRKVWTAEEDAFILRAAGNILHLSDITIKRIITQEPLFIGRSESSIRGRLLRLRRKEASTQ